MLCRKKSWYWPYLPKNTSVAEAVIFDQKCLDTFIKLIKITGNLLNYCRIALSKKGFCVLKKWKGLFKYLQKYFYISFFYFLNLKERVLKFFVIPQQYTCHVYNTLSYQEVIKYLYRKYCFFLRQLSEIIITDHFHQISFDLTIFIHACSDYRDKHLGWHIC